MLVHVITPANAARYDKVRRQLARLAGTRKDHPQSALTPFVTTEREYVAPIVKEREIIPIDAGGAQLVLLDDVGEILAFCEMSPLSNAPRDHVIFRLAELPLPTGPLVWEYKRFEVFKNFDEDEEIAIQVQSIISSATIEFAVKRGVSHLVSYTSCASINAMDMIGLDIDRLSPAHAVDGVDMMVGCLKISNEQLARTWSLMGVYGDVLYEARPAILGDCPAMPVALMDLLSDETNPAALHVLMKRILLSRAKNDR